MIGRNCRGSPRYAAGLRFLPAFVCLFYSHDKSKTDVTKRGIEMFHDESWQPIYFGIKRSKFKVTSHKNVASVGLCTLMGAGV